MKQLSFTLLLAFFSITTIKAQTVSVSDPSPGVAAAYTFTYVTSVNIGTGTSTPNVLYWSKPPGYPNVSPAISSPSLLDPYVTFKVNGVTYPCSSTFGNIGGSWSGGVQLSIAGASTGITISAGSTIEVTIAGLITNPTTPGVYTFNWRTATSGGAAVDSYSDDVTIAQLCTPTFGTQSITTCNSYTWIDGNTYASSNNTATHTLTNAAGCDSTVTLDLTINYSNGSTDMITACDFYTWIDGNTYTASNNTATHVLTNAMGCDSTVTLDLTINYSNGSTDMITACDSYTWIDGNTYTTSNNIATWTLTNAAGCDSIVTLDLTINYSNTVTDVITACDSYTWIDGNTYTVSNNSATYVLTNASGCDSTVTLDLTINYSNTGTDVVTACDSYTWIDGNTYTASNNTATHVLTNTSGCDSTVTLGLTINYSNGSTDIVTACDSYMWVDGNTYTASNNTATHVLANAMGCDSTITLDLTINYSNGSTDVITACDSYTWIDGNTYTASNNTATHVLTNVFGCDSMISLDLTIYELGALEIVSDIDTLCSNINDYAGLEWLNTGNIPLAPVYFYDASNDSPVGSAVEAGEYYAVGYTPDGCEIISSNTVTVYEEFCPQASLNEMQDISLKVYPNPNNGEFIIETDTYSTGASYILRDVSGKTLQQGDISAEKTKVNTQLPSGAYFLTYSTNNYTTVKKIIIQ